MSDKINDGGPAFPVGTKTIHKDHYSGESYPDETGWEGGMSLRDYFAGQALAGLLADGICNGVSHVVPSETGENQTKYPEIDANDGLETAIKAYDLADAMLSEREGRPR